MLRIRNWEQHYEKARTREVRTAKWVPVPIDHDGDGYTALVDHPDGAAHFGAWIAILQIASKCEPRGVLQRRNGEPHTPATLSRISRIPAAIFDAAIPRLCSIGWLDNSEQTIENTAVSDSFPQASRQIATDRDDVRRDREKSRQITTIQNSTIQYIPPPISPPPSGGDGIAEQENLVELPSRPKVLDQLFDEFWESVWLKVGRKDARRAFTGAVQYVRKGKSGTDDRGAALFLMTKAKLEPLGGAEFRLNMHPATWLNGRRWEDEVRVNGPPSVSSSKTTDAFEVAAQRLRERQGG